MLFQLVTAQKDRRMARRRPLYASRFHLKGTRGNFAPLRRRRLLRAATAAGHVIINNNRRRRARTVTRAYRRVPTGARTSFEPTEQISVTARGRAIFRRIRPNDNRGPCIVECR